MRTVGSLRLPLPLPLLALACVSEHGPLTNRMAQSATPYLARAAKQPVSWQQWSRDAFALAARLDRPVLLYIGADDCRWCGVMDREVYGDPLLGAMIDSLFVPVRVDRDERPDVAQRYATAVQLLAGLRGYPITVFLTPDGAAFFGGTYFPLDDPVTGRGLKQLLPEVAKSYREQRASVLQRAELIHRLSLGRRAAAGVPKTTRIQFETAVVRDAVAAAVQAGADLATLRYIRATDLLLVTYERTSDSSYLTPARAVLDYIVDSGEGSIAGSALDVPPEIQRAGWLRNLTAAWAATADPRYRDAARAVARRLANEVASTVDRTVFADRDAYVLGAVLDAAAATGDSAMLARSRATLDTLLRRVYARGRPVRHTVVGGSGGSSGRAMIDDQVQVAWACLAAHDATGAPRYLEIARDLVGVLDRDFADSTSAGYFEAAATDPAAPALIERAKPVLDDLLPAGNATAGRVLLRLADATGEARYRRGARALVDALAATATGAGLRASSYLAVAQDLLRSR